MSTESIQESSQHAEIDTRLQDEGSAESSPHKRPLFVVGIGASAGGLEALERFFQKMPQNSGLAFVVLQHLSPDFKSMMDELLARQTDMRILRAEEGMLVEANTVYLLPPRKEMVINEGKLQLTEKDPSKGLSLPIDVFFRSLAQDLGPRAVAIVLSGTGSDGSRGVRDINAMGGVVFVQDESSSKFDGMPNAAFATGVADQVMPPEEMPDALLRLIKRDRLEAKEFNAVTPTQARQTYQFDSIFAMLQERHGIDFTFYKPTTVTRRIERRMAIKRFKSLDDYCDFLVLHPNELEILYKDLLIGVTSFFRDTEAYEELEKTAIPLLFKNNDSRDEIRVWTPGCATGEEAYSIAILLSEAAAAHHYRGPIKIFATDVHQDSLNTASAGSYGETEALQNVSPERLERYFIKDGPNYRVSTELRRMVVFARHNVIEDPSFTKIDLLSCRNLLIYFQPQTQRRVLALFHFALRPGGIMFLGQSETIGELEDEFSTLHSSSKLFVKKRDNRLLFERNLHLGTPLSPAKILPNRFPQSATRQESRITRAYDSLLDRFMPSGVLINERREILHVFGNARNYLAPVSGRANLDVTSFVEGDLKLAISSALTNAQRTGAIVNFPKIEIKTPSGTQGVAVSVEPLAERASDSHNFFIQIEEVEIPRTTIESSTETGEEAVFNIGEEAHERIRFLEQELKYAKEHLQNTIEELETSNEELQSTNEELLASNEELQSTNEELHSVNEELYTVNGEHERKIQELAELNSDMHNLLQNLDVGTIFLDRRLRIRRFTPSIRDTFHLLPHDIGRPIEHISPAVAYEDFITDVRSALKTGEPKEHETEVPGRGWLLIRIVPYKNSGEVDGLVVTAIDISARRAIEENLRKELADGVAYRSIAEATQKELEDLKRQLHSQGNK